MRIRGRKVVGGFAQGEALVTKENISFMGGVDPNTGVVTESGHEIEGKCITDKILVFPQGKGSTGGSYMIYEMVKRKTAPKAFINIRAEPIVTIGAIIGEIPMVDELSRNPLEIIRTGDFLRVSADGGVVEIDRGRPHTLRSIDCSFQNS